MQMLVYTVLLVAVASVQAQQKCNVPVAPYEETGCKPVYAKEGDVCPLYYNCAEFEGRLLDKCYYNDRIYDKGEQIDGRLTEANCLAGCFCSKHPGQDVTCAHIDCPEFLGVSPLGPGCIRTYNLHHCCSKDTICPPFDKLAKCEFDGKTYYDGQIFYPDDTLKCICKPGFKGELKEPFCAKISCGIELLYTSDIKEKCAPVFYGYQGCPIQWECQDDGVTIIPVRKIVTTGHKCAYKDKELNIGDKLILNRSSSSPKIDCECRIPPLVTCIQKPHE